MTADQLALLPIRHLPAVEERVETGPVAFGDDWPGVFIRGDNALLGFVPPLLRAIKQNENAGGNVFDHMALVSLLQVLQSCNLVKP